MGAIMYEIQKVKLFYDDQPLNNLSICSVLNVASKQNDPVTSTEQIP